MNKKTPLPSLRSQKPTWRKAAALAREWELNQLAGRLEELGPVWLRWRARDHGACLIRSSMTIEFCEVWLT
jgi:hypothetical protein